MRSRSYMTGGVATVVLGFFLTGFILLTMWTDRSLEFWLSYMKGEPVEISWWLSALLTIVLNGVIFVVNLISEIIRLAL